MNADNPEDSKLKVNKKASISSLEQSAESSNEQQTLANWGAARSMQPRGAKLFQDSENNATGSAALGGDDASPPRQHTSKMRVPKHEVSSDDIGFSSLGLSSDITPFREVMQRRDYSQNIASNQQIPMPMNEPMSPTNTNPYQSPEGEKAIPDEFDTDDSDTHNIQFASNRPFGHHARGFQTQHEGTSSDRSQTSSVGAQRTFPSLNTLGGLSGLGAVGPWSNAPGAIGTPTRTMPGFSSGFGDSIFGPMGDVTSPNSNTGGSGSGFLGGAPPSAVGNAGLTSRGSKMGSLFPSAMQEQMRDSLRQEQGFHDSSEAYPRNLPATNAPGFGANLREGDSQNRPGRGTVDEVFTTVDSRNRTPGFTSAFSMNDVGQTVSSQMATSIAPPAPASTASAFVGTPSVSTLTNVSYFNRAQDQDISVGLSNQMPASQQRQMVMPDRMRWIYRDPQGNTQGPWSGLEMHDWYKAGFFSPELQVKKLEDADYEPLAQLIRRIGNSREPFLVPQIGIPHGSSATVPSSNASTSGVVPATTPSAIQSNSAQPPFASSFPSFGTTLTAEQQNALERRKQEEQYLMARQKEHLAQQQVMIKQMQHMQGGSHGLHGQQLHHHSSAHSLQSQPSYGSITSPTSYQPSSVQIPIQAPAAGSGFFDPLSRSNGPSLGPLGGSSETLGSVREDEVVGIMDRLNIGRGGQMQFGGPSYNPGLQGMNHPQQVEAMLQERARLQREQEHYDILQRNTDDHRGTADRLEQYHSLRTQMDDHQQFTPHNPIDSQAGQLPPNVEMPGQDERDQLPNFQDQPHQISPAHKQPERLSLSEQVQKAAALAKQSPSTQPQSPWTIIESGLPQPFPPPQPSSPLPAPAAQRNRQNVADALAAESRSRSQTPVETPSATIAPWAKDTNEGSKGPSLKEIQAMEARKAAQQEEIASAAKRALAEQERQIQAPPMAPAPGLPSSANWASSVSPAVPVTSGPSAWTKPAAGKTPTTAGSSAKKTLAQIQKEEEARKIRAAASAAANAGNGSVSSTAIAGGKRYADLAGKAAISIPQGSSGAWTTVGAGGKVKTPTGPAPVMNARAASSAAVLPASIATKTKSTVPSRGSATSAILNQQAANDDFQKWTKGALSKGLNTGIPG